MYRRFGKRALDLAITLMSLPVVLPLVVIAAIAVRLSLGSPVLFRQVRPGLRGDPFTLYKLRSMTDARDSAGRLLSDSERLKRIGAILRRSSIDELPSLWNVLRGEMSVIGPRPLLMEYLGQYTETQMRRHNVRPGLTGWAQIHGRQDIPFSRRIELDLYYVDHYSLLMDIKILLRTALLVTRMCGVRSGQDVREVDDLGLSRPNPEPSRKENR